MLLSYTRVIEYNSGNC